MRCKPYMSFSFLWPLIFETHDLYNRDSSSGVSTLTRQARHRRPCHDSRERAVMRLDRSPRSRNRQKACEASHAHAHLINPHSRRLMRHGGERACRPYILDISAIAPRHVALLTHNHLERARPTSRMASRPISRLDIGLVTPEASDWCRNEACPDAAMLSGARAEMASTDNDV